MRPACRAGDISLRWPCSECVHVALLGLMLTHLLIWSQWQRLEGGHEGGMEGGPAVEADPALIGVLAVGLHHQHFQRPCRAPDRTWDFAPLPTLPLSMVSGGLFGITPGLCLG